MNAHCLASLFRELSDHYAKHGPGSDFPALLAHDFNALTSNEVTAFSWYSLGVEHERDRQFDAAQAQFATAQAKVEPAPVATTAIAPAGFRRMAEAERRPWRATAIVTGAVIVALLFAWMIARNNTDCARWGDGCGYLEVPR